MTNWQPPALPPSKVQIKLAVESDTGAFCWDRSLKEALASTFDKGTPRGLNCTTMMENKIVLEKFRKWKTLDNGEFSSDPMPGKGAVPVTVDSQVWNFTANKKKLITAGEGTIFKYMLCATPVTNRAQSAQQIGEASPQTTAMDATSAAVGVGAMTGALVSRNLVNLQCCVTKGMPLDKVTKAGFCYGTHCVSASAKEKDPARWGGDHTNKVHCNWITPEKPGERELAGSAECLDTARARLLNF